MWKLNSISENEHGKRIVSCGISRDVYFYRKSKLFRDELKIIKTFPNFYESTVFLHKYLKIMIHYVIATIFRVFTLTKMALLWGCKTGIALLSGEFSELELNPQPLTLNASLRNTNESVLLSYWHLNLTIEFFWMSGHPKKFSN